MTLVLDASMTMAAIFEDESDPLAQHVIRRVAVDGGSTPSLWRLEIANALQMALKRGRCDVTFVDRVLGYLMGLPIEIDPETDDRAWSSTLGLAREESLTVYDAAYLELAIRLGASLASRDKQLVAAARRRGVEVVTV